jgi:Ca2+-binding EF-hand superfamily protein
MLLEAFKRYDTKESGVLDYKELRQFIDHLRGALNLLPSDKDIQDRIVGI